MLIYKRRGDPKAKLPEDFSFIFMLKDSWKKKERS
jgi:hypothetical protein